MSISSKTTVALLVLLGALGLEAQFSSAPGPVMSLGGPALSQQAPNTLVLGSGTEVTYDSNALSSQPPTPNVQYTIYPQIGLNLARPRWDALISFVPGFSYSSANLPQYQAVSLTSAVTLQYRPSQRLSLNFLNSLISSGNPFDNLTSGYRVGTGGTTTAVGTALNYLPKTNVVASTDAVYSLRARTSLTASASYNYISYPHDSNIPNAAQPFQQSNSAQLVLGLRRSSSPKYQGGVLYSAQIFDAGQGQLKTVGQSVQYALQYAPTSALGISAMIGPEYVRNSYAGVLGGGGVADVVNRNASGWSWTGSAGMTWKHGESELSASVSKQLGMGTQYQGNVDEVLLNAGFHRRLPGRTDLSLFGGYNINRPVFLAQSVPRFSNNYLSTGGALSKTIDRCWVIGIAYWYLQQNGPQTAVDLYSGNHSRVALSLSYSMAKSLRK
jgi:hypothetical protein